MASLYERKRDGKRCSPVWWIKYRDSKGVIRREPTRFQIGVGADTRSAEQLRAEHALRESRMMRANPEHRWENWVPKFLEERYGHQWNTHARYRQSWRRLEVFLTANEILTPLDLAREHCSKYMDWRKGCGAGKPALHNTARYEIKLLARVMKEAVIRGYAQFNCCRELGIKSAKVRLRPEFTPEAMALIDAGLEQEPEPSRTILRNSSLIARYHGARISETHLNPMTAIRLNGSQSLITFNAKGNKEHMVQLHPKLVAFFEQLRARGATETYPKIPRTTRVWGDFLRRIGITAQITKDGQPFGPLLPGASFHSHRHMVISILSRAGFSDRQIMQYVGHASTSVSRGYARWHPEDLAPCAAAIV